MYDKQSNISNPGVPHVGVTQQAQRPSGMPCPQCGGFIPVSMQQIIKFQQAQRDFDKRSKNF